MNFITKLCKTSVMLMLVCTMAYAQDPNFHIYICFGQSNMEGQGTIEAQDQTVDARFQILQSVNCTGQPQNAWRTAKPPLCRCNTKLGPADYFGRELVKNLPSNIKVGVVHVAVAGCKIELFDKNNYQTYVNSLTSSEQWMKDIIAQYGGNPYARIVQLAKLAQKDGAIKGILLHQGESNAGDPNWPNKVKGVYTNLLTDLGLSASNVPLLAGQVVDAAHNGATAGMNNIINTLPNTIPTAHVISSSGLAAVSDNLHFTSASYRTFGQRYAQQMLALLSTTSINTPPTVSISSPVANATFTAPASITISANAADANGTVTGVQFFSGTTLLGSDLTAPYSFSWSGVLAGTYTLTAKATDNGGAVTTSAPITVVVNPLVIAQTPFNGTPSLIPGTIQAEEYDFGGEGVAYHETTAGNSGNSLFRNGDSVDMETTTDGGGGINVGWIAAGEWLEYTVNVLTSGVYSLDVRVAATASATFHIEMDGVNVSGTLNVPNTGGFQTFQTVSINNVSLTAGTKVMRIAMDASYFNINYVAFRSLLPNILPTVSLISPTSTSTYTAPASVTISAIAADSDGTVSNVQFYNGSTLIGSDATSPYSFTWANVSAGTYSVTAKATDNAGAFTVSSPVTITVNPAPNVPPTVSISSPLNNASFTAPASITINASAADVDGTVANVQFYNGATLLGSDATSPYNYIWNSVGAGTYTITAIAIDNKGASTVSIPVSLVVSVPMGDIIGRNCGIKNTSGSYSLAANNKTNATSYSWYYTGSVQSLIQIAGDPSKITLNYGNNFTSGDLCIGVNYSVSPWYKQFCLPLTVCPAGTRADDGIDDMPSIRISPNPSASSFTLTAGEEILSVTVVDINGLIVYSSGHIAAGSSVQLGENLSNGMYLANIQYTSGKSEAKKIQKIQ